MIPLGMSKSKFTYSLNDQVVTADMIIISFDMADSDEKSDNYLILFRPFIVMVYNGEAILISHVNINIVTQEAKWTEQLKGKEIPKEKIDPNLAKRIIAEILLG